MATHLWIRAEERPTERRTPVMPGDVRRLLDAGLEVSVEESPQRIVPIEEYADAGATIVPRRSWVDAPQGVFVVGIKELPDEPHALRHDHVFFAHAFKGQDGARELLGRFVEGGGRIHDVEFLTDRGRRVAAFSYWAGYIGAALAVLQLRGRLETPLAPMGRADLDGALRQAGDPVRALVTGALGRSGRGACDALEVAGIEPTRWDLEETRDLDKATLLAHDLMVNCVVTTDPGTPFLTDEDLQSDHALRVIGDVTCDVTGPTNMLPVNTAVTTWQDPVRVLRGPQDPHGALDIIAVDNLPSLLPLEASAQFSSELTPHLLGLADPAGPTPVWRAAAAAYEKALG